MKKANDILLKALGALLIIAGALKGWQLLTEPVANNSIWTWRPFMVLQVDKDWFVTTPAVALLTDGQVTSVWKAKAPDLDINLKNMVNNAKNNGKIAIFINKSFNTFGIYDKEVVPMG